MYYNYTGALILLDWSHQQHVACHLCPSLSSATTTTAASTVLRPFVRDYPGEPVPEGTFTHSPILIINLPVSASSIYYDPYHSPCSVYVLDNLFAQPLSKSSLVSLLVWNRPLHTPYISSPSQCLLQQVEEKLTENQLTKVRGIRQWLMDVFRKCLSVTPGQLLTEHICCIFICICRIYSLYLSFNHDDDNKNIKNIDKAVY